MVVIIFLPSLCGSLRFMRIPPGHCWEVVALGLYETGALGRRAAHERVPGSRLSCALCRRGEDRWERILGVQGIGWSPAKRRARDVGAWDGVSSWRWFLPQHGVALDAKRAMIVLLPYSLRPDMVAGRGALWRPAPHRLKDGVSPCRRG